MYALRQTKKAQYKNSKSGAYATHEIFLWFIVLFPIAYLSFAFAVHFVATTFLAFLAPYIWGIILPIWFANYAAGKLVWNGQRRFHNPLFWVLVLMLLSKANTLWWTQVLTKIYSVFDPMALAYSLTDFVWYRYVRHPFAPYPLIGWIAPGFTPIKIGILWFGSVVLLLSVCAGINLSIMKILKTPKSLLHKHVRSLSIQIGAVLVLIPFVQIAKWIALRMLGWQGWT